MDSELPSPAAGVLTEILVQEGDTVEVGARLAVIGETASASPRRRHVRPPRPAAPRPRPRRRRRSATAPARARRAPPPATASARPTGEAAVTSPVVRRILEDAEPRRRGASRARGPGGTITRRDAEQAVLRTARPSTRSCRSTKGRQRMAEHMSASVAAAPHAFVAIEADASAIARLEALGGTTRDGVAIEPSTVVAVAVVRALGEFELLERDAWPTRG